MIASVNNKIDRKCLHPHNILSSPRSLTDAGHANKPEHGLFLLVLWPAVKE